jgi:large subunit ribosomal protein L27
MAKTKSGGSARGNRDSAAQRLGIKIYDGQKVKIGMVIVRQRGSKYILGKNVKKGSDDTIYAMKDGIVNFSTKIKKLYNGSSRVASVVSVK